MIRALKRLTDWLDRRFPPRLVVTVEQFDAYADRLHRVEQHFAAFREDSYAVAERVVVLEKSLTAMKDAIQFGVPSCTSYMPQTLTLPSAAHVK